MATVPPCEVNQLFFFFSYGSGVPADSFTEADLSVSATYCHTPHLLYPYLKGLSDH